MSIDDFDSYPVKAGLLARTLKAVVLWILERVW
jgi:hypothetical protein